jgi:uncharacterized protein DUF4232
MNITLGRPGLGRKGFPRLRQQVRADVSFFRIDAQPRLSAHVFKNKGGEPPHAHDERNDMLNRTLGAIAGLFTGAVLLAGCSQPPSAGGIATGQDGSPAGLPRGGTMSEISADESASSDNRPQAFESNCAATAFKVDLNVQPDRPGILLMAVTNNSKGTCELNGYVDLVPTNMKGDQLHDVPKENVAVPGEPVDISLAPGESAFAGVRIELGDKADPNTMVATGFEAKLPGTAGTTSAEVIGTEGTSPQYFEFPIKSMQVGSLQPAAQGVTVF